MQYVSSLRDLVTILVYDFMNFNALKVISKIDKKKIRMIQSRYSHMGIYLWSCTNMQIKRPIPATVNEKIVIKCLISHTLRGGTSLVMALENRRMNRSAGLENFFHPLYIRYL